MSMNEFIITVFCLIEDQLESLLNGKKLRQRGFRTRISLVQGDEPLQFDLMLT